MPATTARRPPAANRDSTDDLISQLESLGRILTSRQLYNGLAALAGVELSQQGMQVLRALHRKGRQPVAELARHAMMDIAAVSRQVRALEERGLAKRQASDHDGRVAMISMTPAGTRMVKRMLAVQHRQADLALAGWSRKERAELQAVLERLVNDLRTGGAQDG